MSDAVPETPPIVLVFAANDPSGGAGMQADLLTLSSMGCHPLPVITWLGFISVNSGAGFLRSPTPPRA